MKYAGKEINLTVERLVEIASLTINGLREDDEDSAMEYLVDTVDLSEEEAEFFGIDYQKMKAASKY